MQEKPKVKTGDWIGFGSGPLRKSAVICNVYKDDSWADIEVVFLDERDRAINKDMVWGDNGWEFKQKGASGGYADSYSRLSKYVAQLRRGRY